MRIVVLVKPNAKKESVEKIDDSTYQVRVNAPPHEGRANEAVTMALADFFKISRSRVQIVKGQKSKKKLVEIT